MTAPLMNRRDLEFMLYELFEVESMLDRPRYTDHNRETIDAAIDTAKTVAEKYLLPIRQKAESGHPPDRQKVDTHQTAERAERAESGHPPAETPTSRGRKWTPTSRRSMAAAESGYPPADVQWQESAHDS